MKFRNQSSVVNVSAIFIAHGLLCLLFLLNFSLQSQSYYWVGGSGNWSDPAHWQSDKGGIPTIFDHVIFNDSSFTQNNEYVNLDVHAACKNMNWSVTSFNPKITGDSSLTIDGSVALKPGMRVLSKGNIYFTSSIEDQTINFNNVKLPGNIYFQGTGSWILENDIIVLDSTIFLLSGTLDTKDFNISCGSFSSTGSSPRILKLNSSTVLINGYNGFWDVSNEFLVERGTSSIIFENPLPSSESVFRGGSRRYHKVEFRNHGILLSNNKFDILKLNAGNSYAFESNKTQTIINDFIARGCSGLINIHPTAYERATIRKSDGDINVSFVSLKSIEADMGGGGKFNANNSIDLGGNLNCNIIKNARDVRWVNGTGYWSDTLHWEMIPPNDLDARCVPISYDNVYFDNNSFSAYDTVKVDLNSTYCHDLFWNSNLPVVFKNELDSSNINIYGSLKLTDGMENKFDGAIYFRDSTGNQTISSEGVSFFGDIYFSGKGGWNITGPLTAQRDIYFNNGSLATHDNTIQCASFVSDSGRVRTLDIGSSTIILNSLSSVPDLLINNEGLEFLQDKSVFIFEKPSAFLKAYGGDTLRFHNVIFSSEDDLAILRNDSTYLEFYEADLKANTEIYGSNSFNFLKLKGGNVYALHAGRTQTIVEDIEASGDCENPLMIQSLRIGVNAYLYKKDGNVTLNHVALRDIAASGGATFNAYSAVDLGNNSGWDEIAGSEYRKLYWVGGQGRWGDPQHWALSSNGLGGECVPTPEDDVIFDQYSFDQAGDSVIIANTNAFCHSLIWSEKVKNPILYSDKYTSIRIFGSLDLTQHMSFAFNGPLYFESSETGNTISSDGVKFNNSNNQFYFENPVGEWTLMDSLDLGSTANLNNSIYYLGGTLNTNNQEISCYSFISNSSANRKLILGESILNILNAFYIYGIGIELVENKSEINIYRGNFTHRRGSGHKYNKINFRAADRLQRHLVIDSDSLSFNKIVFENEGLMSGSNSFVLATDIQFQKDGQLNQPTTADANVYSIGNVHFQSTGSIYGSDTCHFVQFDSTALIDGNNVFGHVLFNDNGKLLGENTFDSLTFRPGHVYHLEELRQQRVNDYIDIRGNNCQPIYLRSSGLELASLHKASDSVFGEFIELYNIEAGGGAWFDAGYYSENVDNSSTGWVFHDNPLKFRLDSVIYDIDKEVEICASNFNGTPGTQYIWQKYPEGDTLGIDSCFTLTPDLLGLFKLTVIYDEGEGCVRYDTLLWGCQYFVDLNKSNINCYGNMDGYIELDIREGTGTEPFEISWYHGDEFLSNSPRIDNLDIGEYHFVIEDGDGCSQSGSYELTQPDSLSVDFYVNYFNYFVDAIVEGGTLPYEYVWNSGSTASFEKVVESGRHNITVTDSNGCEIKSAIFIDLRYKALAPNAFSPNGDGLNDEFILYWQGPDIRYYLLEIYDRWGQKIFESTDPDYYWNGSAFNLGDILPMGTYVWKLHVQTINDKTENDQGIISLIR